MSPNAGKGAQRAKSRTSKPSSTQTPKGVGDVGWARILFDALQNDLAVMLEGGRIRDINATGLGMLGVDSADHVLGVYFADFIDRDQLASALAVLSGKAAPGTEVMVRLQSPAADASVTQEPISVAISSVSLPGKDALALRARRISGPEDRNSEDLLGSDLYRYLFESSQAMISVLDRDGYILMSNESAWRILGYGSSLELVGRPFLHTVHPDYHSVIDAGMDLLAELLAEAQAEPQAAR